MNFRISTDHAAHSEPSVVCIAIRTASKNNNNQFKTEEAFEVVPLRGHFSTESNSI